MKKICWLLFLIAVFSVVITNPVFAAEPSSDEIWTKLANKASKVGGILQRSGFYIAGIGLIFFSFMAIFNKISWKNLAYIMLSCLVLSGIVGLVNYFSVKGDKAWEMKESTFNGPDSNNIEFKEGVAPAGGTNPS